MVKELIILLVGLFLGLHPKNVPNKELIKLASTAMAFIVVTIVIAMILGYPALEVLLLKVNHITVSGLAVMYAIMLGIFIKGLKNVLA